MQKVAVVILGWNGKNFLAEYLPSVVAHSTYNWCEIVYLDNASDDDSVSFVKQNFPTVTVVQNEKNYGFAGGYNEGLKKIDATYFLLLNQDVNVTANWLPPMLALMQSDSEVAAVQPKLRADKSKAYFEYAGAAGGMMDFLGYAFCRGRVFEHIEKDENQYNQIAEIFWGSGACLLVRADLFCRAGGLDEAFFAHQEEIDLCWRLINMGYKIMYCPDSIVYHLGGGSLPQGNPRKTYLNFRNNLFLLTKNLPLSKLWWTLPFRMVLDGVAALQSVIKHKHFADFNAIVKAHFSFYGQFFAMYKKRQFDPQKGYEKLYKKSIVWQHFIKGKEVY